MMNLRDLLDDPDFVQTVPYSKESFKAQDVILGEEEDSQDVYFILEGEVQVSTTLGEMGHNLEKFVPGLARLAKGDFFGELSMIDGEPRSTQVTAETDCEIVKVDGPQMIAFMDRFPEKGYFVLRELFMNLVLRMRQNNIRTKTVLELYLQER